MTRRQFQRQRSHHHPEAFEYAYDKFCIYNADNKMSHHNIAADGFQITDDKLESFKSRVGEFYFNLAKGQECIVKTYDEEDETLMLVLHGSYRRSVPAWEGPQIKTLFYRPATEDALRFKKKTGTLSIKAPYKRDKENYIKIFTEVIVEDRSQATRPDRDVTYTLEPLQNGTFSFAGNEAISGVTLLEVRLSLHGTATPEVVIRSHDVLRTLQEGLGGNIRLDAGGLVHAALTDILDRRTFTLPIETMVAPLLPDSMERPLSAHEITEEQRKDYQIHKYLCRDRIHLPGDVPMPRNNLILINGEPVNLPDAPFALLFRLAVALWQDKNGWIETPTLWEERIIPDPGKHQPFSNLRKIVEEHLGSKDGKQFIENDRTKRYRLSTHPDFITCDREKLFHHPDDRTRRIARQWLKASA